MFFFPFRKDLTLVVMCILTPAANIIQVPAPICWQNKPSDNAYQVPGD